MAEKTYINGIFIKKVTTSFGDILKCSVKADSFIEEIKKHTNSKGYVNFDLLNRKEADKNGNTHYAVLNTYEATKQTEPAKEFIVEDSKEESALPF